jgi:hypothetical protein
MFKAACDGEYNFLETVREYGNRAKKMKAIFEKHGFHIVYDKDIDQTIGDGFYFTVGYKDLTGGELMYKLLFYGISAISLDTTGSRQQGLRVCTSFIQDNQYDDLDQRLAEFAKENYGFAGPKFVDLVKDLPVEVLTKTRKDFERKIKAEAEAQGSVKEEKQILPLSLILTADKLATELFFEDGIYLDIPTMVRQLKDVEDVSEGKRAYETILDYSIMYKSKFSESEYAPESWGLIKDGYINIVPAAMRRIAQEQNFSVKAFCAWAKDHLVLRTNNKKNQFVMKVGDNFQRFYSVKQELIEEISGFETITEAIEEEIPFD